jgi:hypothetical protein
MEVLRKITKIAHQDNRYPDGEFNSGLSEQEAGVATDRL